MHKSEQRSRLWLCRELDEEGLRVVKVECENRLGLGPAGVQ